MPNYFCIPLPCVFQQGRLLATVNCKVHVLEWRLGEDQQRELVSTCSHHGHIMALYAAARGDFIIIGKAYFSIDMSHH